MIESIVSGFVSLIVFAVGYGSLREKVTNLESKNKDLETALKLEVSNLENKNRELTNDLKQISDMKVMLEGIRVDIMYIKKSIEHEPRN